MPTSCNETVELFPKSWSETYLDTYLDTCTFLRTPVSYHSHSKTNRNYISYKQGHQEMSIPTSKVFHASP